MKKLNRYRASYFLAQRCTAIQSDLRSLAQKRNFAGLLQAVINHLRVLHANREFVTINAYINHLSRAYGRGNGCVRYLIENLFVRSLGFLKKNSTPAEWIVLYNHLPLAFVHVYEQQLREEPLK